MKNYLNSILFITTFFLVLLILHPFIVLSSFFGRRALNIAVYCLCRSILLVLRIAGVKITVTGSPPEMKTHQGKPLVIVSNHQGMFDIPLIICSFIAYFPRFIAKKELGKNIPSISATLRGTKACLIDRSDKRGATEIIEEFAHDIDNDPSPYRSCVIFPEGTRARDGKVRPFRLTGLSTLASTIKNAVIQPLIIDGSWLTVEHSFWPIPRGIHLTLNILPPLEAHKVAENPIVAEEVIIKALAKMRAEKDSDTEKTEG
jgi:1-acyl-sn-glycerol-3-phosphate acyltransferase